MRETVYECRYGFESASCDVFIEVHGTVNSGPVFVARGYVVNDAKHSLERVLNDKGNEVDVHGGSAEDAATRWAQHVQSKFGAIVSGPAEIPDYKSPRRIL
jgi:hypothetical protein